MCVAKVGAAVAGARPGIGAPGAPRGVPMVCGENLHLKLFRQKFNPSGEGGTIEVLLW